MYEGTLTSGLAKVKAEKMKSLNIKAVTTKDKGETYLAGNLRASIFHWRVRIAELKN